METIEIFVNGTRRSLTEKAILKRLYNRAIELALSPEHRISHDSTIGALRHTKNMLESLYLDAVREEIRRTRGGPARQKALEDASRRALPTLLSLTMDTTIRQLSDLFLDHNLAAIGFEGGPDSVWDEEWLTEVIPGIVRLASTNDIALLDDPNHQDLQLAADTFHDRILSGMQDVSLDRLPRRNIDRPETLIEFRMIRPRRFYTLDLMEDEITYHPHIKWTRGVWDLWTLSDH